MEDEEELPPLDVLLAPTPEVALVSDEEWTDLKVHLLAIKNKRVASRRFAAYSKKGRSAVAAQELAALKATYSCGGLPIGTDEELVVRMGFDEEVSLIFDVFLPEAILWLLCTRLDLTVEEAEQRMRNPPLDETRKLAFEQAGAFIRNCHKT